MAFATATASVPHVEYCELTLRPLVKDKGAADTCFGIPVLPRYLKPLHVLWTLEQGALPPSDELFS